MRTSEEIKRRLWDGANELRGSMDASRYKDYMLGLMFYKFLSDKTLEEFKDMGGYDHLNDYELVDEYISAKERYGSEALFDGIKSRLGYYVAPEYLYHTWLKDIDSGDFALENVTDSLHSFEHSMVIETGNEEFKNLFSSSTIDLNDSALGSNLNERSRNIRSLILLFADFNMVSLQENDILGDAYEYLIGQFALESGKKAGEFYTPRQVSEVMAQIVAKSSDIKSIYDPAVGSGSLLLTVGKHLDRDSQINLNYFGQERNTATYNLTRMNLLLHGIKPHKMNIRNDDTLVEDWPEDPSRPGQGVQFDAVVMNPPYSAKNWNRSGLRVSDPRFSLVGTLPPNSKGDYAFLLHGLYHLNVDGTMAIVLPHGVLFRGGAEGEIRKRLIDKNYFDAVIGLPSNLFTNTGIPVTVIILKKNRELDDPVLFIDAFNEFIKVGKNNVLQEKHISKIVDTYLSKTQEEGYSSLVYRDELLENEYNMNIPRYVIAKDDEIDHDVDAHLLGGIPKINIEKLKILNSIVPHIIRDNLETIRSGYVSLVNDIDKLTHEVLNSSEVLNKTEKMSKDINEYIDKYWPILTNIVGDTDIKDLMDNMLLDIKELLSSYDFINIYDGYQNIADIWRESLTKDLEIISSSGFYKAARTRVPNMVMKGSGQNRRQEQDGWLSNLIPNNLIRDHIFNDEALAIEDLKTKVSEIESELDELVEAAKVEDSEENEVLYECITKNSEGEPGNSFRISDLRNELKLHEKGSEEYVMIKNVEKLMTDRTKTNRIIRESTNELNEMIYEKILILTDEEIDSMVFKKWFNNLTNLMIDLIEKPLKDELDILKMLGERYNSTLDDLDEEYKIKEESFEEMLSNLVVVK